MVWLADFPSSATADQSVAFPFPVFFDYGRTIEEASLKRIAPTWMNVSLAMKKNPEADKAFGWVLEMYAYVVASALHGVGNILYKDFMIQPPWDLEVGKKFIIHYTYGCDYDLKGKLTNGKIGEWRFEKRSYDHSPPPKNLPLLPDGVPKSAGREERKVVSHKKNDPHTKYKLVFHAADDY